VAMLTKTTRFDAQESSRNGWKGKSGRVRAPIGQLWGENLAVTPCLLARLARALARALASTFARGLAAALFAAGLPAALARRGRLVCSNRHGHVKRRQERYGDNIKLFPRPGFSYRGAPVSSVVPLLAARRRPDQ